MGELYNVLLSPNADRFLAKLDEKERERIKKRLGKLEERPRYFGENRGDFWIIKIGRGGYRASFNIDEEANYVFIHEIEKRESSGYEREFYD